MAAEKYCFFVSNSKVNASYFYPPVYTPYPKAINTTTEFNFDSLFETVVTIERCLKNKGKLSQDLLDRLHSYIQYPLPHQGYVIINRLIKTTIQVCNSEAILPEQKIELAKFLSLHIGIQSLLPQLQFSEQELSSINQFFEQELDRFFLPPWP